MCDKTPASEMKPNMEVIITSIIYSGIHTKPGSETGLEDLGKTHDMDQIKQK